MNQRRDLEKRELWKFNRISSKCTQTACVTNANRQNEKWSYPWWIHCGWNLLERVMNASSIHCTYLCSIICNRKTKRKIMITFIDFIFLEKKEVEDNFTLKRNYHSELIECAHWIAHPVKKAFCFSLFFFFFHIDRLCRRMEENVNVLPSFSDWMCILRWVNL